MSHTSPRRFARLAAGLTVAAAATATSLLGAAPAYAQGTSVTANVSNGTLNVSGTSFGDSITATGTSSTIDLSNTTGSISVNNPGCTQLGATVRCTGVTSILFVGFGGDDTFNNQTSRRSSLFGASGNDSLTGGSRNDRLDGGAGVDVATGGPGIDRCTAEKVSGCEL